ncbi:MAG: Glycerophosphoryl diester phosphodiesterase [uncultured Frankineae bacterium]|uniref:Glycerophosphoryl diester phosphodiesterase n=1 Tax=uncultured Frankineae bacterium TaxID=437475 RepID=A0A6J4M0J4_9ACTN|nr:MAG: Glycerophosphoryl diester phosphodiesterase [uncultured Frankineae bacterium]
MRLLAHRGMPGPASVDGPVENTLPALRACLAAGADGAEVDVRLSSDGVLVVSHDPTLLRITGSPMTVADSRWEVLRDSCAYRGVALARAEELLVALDGRRAVLEVKRPPQGRVAETAQVLVATLAALRRTGVALDVTVSSFARDAVEAVRDAAPAALGLRTALLGDVGDPPAALVRAALDSGFDEVHPQVGELLRDPATVATAHAVGVAVVPWTVNRGRALRRLAALGTDAVITDVPAGARLALHRVPAGT